MVNTLKHKKLYPDDAEKAARLGVEVFEKLRDRFGGEFEFDTYRMYDYFAGALAIRQKHRELADVARKLPLLKSKKGEGHFKAARYLAQCCDLAVKDESLTADSRAVAIRTNENDAIRLLQLSADLGYPGTRKIQTDPFFKPLNNRDEFRNLLRQKN